MKHCNKCNTEQPIENFSKKGNKIQSICKSCHKIYCKEHYKNNTLYYCDKSKNRRQHLKEFIKELRNGECSDCKNSFPYVCLDFDHLNDKKYTIASMWKQGFSKENILKEVAKCEIVCSNCHRIRTAKRLGIL